MQYRFINRNRRGKWYDDVREAQRRANEIGAGFLDASGHFQPYRGTVLELRERPDDLAKDEPERLL